VIFWYNKKPKPFNPEFRPGFAAALSSAYAQWWEDNPKATQEQAQEAHARLAKELEPRYPKTNEVFGQ
jgi:hypothetical protein